MYVYILKCEDNSLYTGIAANPERRLRQHLGLIKGGAKYTKWHKVCAVMALWKDDTGEYARRLEALLKKRLSHSQKLLLIKTKKACFGDFDIDVPDDAFEYVDPKELNEKYFRKCSAI